MVENAVRDQYSTLWLGGPNTKSAGANLLDFLDPRAEERLRRRAGEVNRPQVRHEEVCSLPGSSSTCTRSPLTGTGTLHPSRATARAARRDARSRETQPSCPLQARSSTSSDAASGSSPDNREIADLPGPGCGLGTPFNLATCAHEKVHQSVTDAESKARKYRLRA